MIKVIGVAVRGFPSCFATGLVHLLPLHRVNSISSLHMCSLIGLSLAFAFRFLNNSYTCQVFFFFWIESSPGFLGISSTQSFFLLLFNLKG